MAAYNDFEKKVQVLIRRGINVDAAIRQVQEEWSSAEEASRYALLARQKLE